MSLKGWNKWLTSKDHDNYLKYIEKMLDLFLESELKLEIIYHSCLLPSTLLSDCPSIISLQCFVSLICSLFWRIFTFLLKEFDTGLFTPLPLLEIRLLTQQSFNILVHTHTSKRVMSLSKRKDIERLHCSSEESDCTWYSFKIQRPSWVLLYSQINPISFSLVNKNSLSQQWEFNGLTKSFNDFLVLVYVSKWSE